MTVALDCVEQSIIHMQESLDETHLRLRRGALSCSLRSRCSLGRRCLSSQRSAVCTHMHKSFRVSLHCDAANIGQQLATRPVRLGRLTSLKSGKEASAHTATLACSRKHLRCRCSALWASVMAKCLSYTSEMPKCEWTEAEAKSTTLEREWGKSE